VLGHLAAGIKPPAETVEVRRRPLSRVQAAELSPGMRLREVGPSWLQNPGEQLLAEPVRRRGNVVFAQGRPGAVARRFKRRKGTPTC